MKKAGAKAILADSILLLLIVVFAIHSEYLKHLLGDFLFFLMAVLLITGLLISSILIFGISVKRHLNNKSQEGGGR